MVIMQYHGVNDTIIVPWKSTFKSVTNGGPPVQILGSVLRLTSAAVLLG